MGKLHKRRFRIERHEEYGSIGLAPVWLPNQNEPARGMQIAHDVLEHSPKGDDCEFPAIGAALWLRGQGGYWNDRYNWNPITNLASDFPSLAHAWDNEELPDAMRTRALDPDNERELQAVLHEGVKLTRNEEAPAWSKANQQRILHWMRQGYRAASKRWRNYSPGQLVCAFRAIEKAVDEFLKYHEEHEGLEAELTFCLDDATARVSLVEDFDGE